LLQTNAEYYLAAASEALAGTHKRRNISSLFWRKSSCQDVPKLVYLAGFRCSLPVGSRNPLAL